VVLERETKKGLGGIPQAPFHFIQENMA